MKHPPYEIYSCLPALATGRTYKFNHTIRWIKSSHFLRDIELVLAIGNCIVDMLPIMLPKASSLLMSESSVGDECAATWQECPSGDTMSAFITNQQIHKTGRCDEVRQNGFIPCYFCYFYNPYFFIELLQMYTFTHMNTYDPIRTSQTCTPSPTLPCWCTFEPDALVQPRSKLKMYDQHALQRSV